MTSMSQRAMHARPTVRRRAPWAALIAALIFVAGTQQVVEAQQISPLAGQGYPPESIKEVFISVFLERLLAVDQDNYRFTCILYFYISWEDRSAFLTVLKNAQHPGANEIQDLSWLPPGVADMDTDAYAAYYNITLPEITGAGVTCNKFCGTSHALDPSSLFCCDFIYLPSFHFRNVYALPQDRQIRDEINFSGPAPVGFQDNVTLPPIVTWWAFVMAEYYTPMDFKSYPFDSQELVVNMQFYDPGATTAGSAIQPRMSALGKQLYTPQKGDSLAEWAIKDMSFYVDIQFSGINYDGALNDSLPSDKAPVAINKAGCTTPGGCNYYFSNWNTFTPAQDILIPITIYVTRFTIYHILNDIVPIVLTTVLAFIVFWIDPKDLASRSSIVLTLFLALTALQFVLSSSLPSSSYILPTQILTLMSYVMLLLLQACNMLVFYIVNYQIKTRINKVHSAYLQMAAVRKAADKPRGAKGFLMRLVHRSGRPEQPLLNPQVEMADAHRRPAADFDETSILQTASDIEPEELEVEQVEGSGASGSGHGHADGPNGHPRVVPGKLVDEDEDIDKFQDAPEGPPVIDPDALPVEDKKRKLGGLKRRVMGGKQKDTRAIGRVRSRPGVAGKRRLASTTMTVNGERVFVTKELRLAVLVDRTLLAVLFPGYIIATALIFVMTQ